MRGCYLIHFDVADTSPNGAKTVCHYLGWASNSARRVRSHQAGSGARLMSVVTAAEVTWRVVRRWKDAIRQDERRLKRRHHHAALCSICHAKRPGGAA
jgi:predicted GIY-YIG superfamily endonuclease